MTKIKLDFESDDPVEKVVVDVKYKNQKVIVKEYQVQSPQSVSEVVEKTKEVPTKTHGFDSNMMDVVNS